MNGVFFKIMYAMGFKNLMCILWCQDLAWLVSLCLLIPSHTMQELKNVLCTWLSSTDVVCTESIPVLLHVREGRKKRHTNLYSWKPCLFGRHPWELYLASVLKRSSIGTKSCKYSQFRETSSLFAQQNQWTETLGPGAQPGMSPCCWTFQSARAMTLDALVANWA